jgi:quinol monooxygenase YgiN
MDKVALYVRLQAKKGKEKEVEKFLCDVRNVVDNEFSTSTWFALRLGPSTFGIFDTFPDEQGRKAHLSGKIAQALQERSSELFSQPPSIEKADILAEKLPEVLQY